MAIDFRQYTIRQLPRKKGFRFKFEKTFLPPREKSSRERDIKSQAGQRRSTAPF